MNYIQITEDFVKEHPEYKNDILNFNDYLEIQWKNSLADETIRFLLQGLNVEFILSSLIYNVEDKRKYKSKTSAKKYATVVGQFFHFVRKNTDIENPRLYDAISYNRVRENAYMKKMMTYIDNCEQLAGIVEQEALGQSDVIKILNWADEQLENDKDWYSDRGVINTLELKKAMAALGIKFMLLYGITYRELRKIRADQYDDIRNCITINGFELRLPIGLATQMKKMKSFLESNHIRGKQGLFFIVDENGQPWGENTSSSGIPEYLRALLGITSLTGLIKYGISQLLKAGLNDSIIKEITGASDKLLLGCIVHDDGDLWRIINNKLVTVDLYYRF